MRFVYRICNENDVRFETTLDWARFRARDMGDASIQRCKPWKGADRIDIVAGDVHEVDAIFQAQDTVHSI